MRIEGAQPVLEGFQRHKFRKLTAQNFGVPSEMMGQDLRRLLLLREVSALVEATRARRVHEEVRRSVQFDDKTARPGWRAIGTRYVLTRLQLYALDVSEWKLDLVTSRIVVDVVGKASLVGRVEDDEVHSILTHATPGPNAQRTASEVVDDCCC